MSLVDEVREWAKECAESTRRLPPRYEIPSGCVVVTMEQLCRLAEIAKRNGEGKWAR